jgi:hypothetical protein
MSPAAASVHSCPLACSRCDATCPCTCQKVTLREFSDGLLTYEADVCMDDLKGTSMLRRSYNDLMLWVSDRRYPRQSVKPPDTSDDWSDLGYWDGR